MHAANLHLEAATYTYMLQQASVVAAAQAVLGIGMRGGVQSSIAIGIAECQWIGTAEPLRPDEEVEAAWEEGLALLNHRKPDKQVRW